VTRIDLRRAVMVVGVLGIVAPFAQADPTPKLDYPATKRVNHLDTYHGTRVHDPYRWLEQSVRDSKEVRQWVEAQNDVTFSYLQSIPERSMIRSRLTEIWNYERYGTPSKVGNRYIFSKNDGLQNQSVVYTMQSLDDKPKVLLNPNKWSKDGTVALAGMSVSDDGRYVAYARAEAGSDWKTWHVRDIQTGEDLPEVIRWSKFTGAEWTPDSKGFFYTRFPEPDDEAFTSLNTDAMLYYHRVGTQQSEDVLVYKEPDHPKWGFSPTVTEDGRYLVIQISKGTDDKYRIKYRDLSEPLGMPVDLIETFDNEYTFLGNDGPVFYFKTDLEAPRGRVIAIDTREPSPRHAREIIPQTRNTLRSVNIINNMFVAQYLEDAKSLVRLYDMNGRRIRDLDLPGIGTVRGLSGKRHHSETFYQFSSFATPPRIYHYDLITGESALFRKANVDVNAEDYVTKQIFYRSKDGTRVPMFITHHKNWKPDGDTPTLLYGYGGFNIPITPYFSITRAAWLEMGGVYAVANIRGGGEYGEKWHKAGTKLDKQNVFDDFIAAAEWLIDSNYTHSDKLAIRGGSNGGLLVGACMTQRPDLFGACLPAVGVMDMLRFHTFTIGWAWVDDYGSSDDPEQFEALYAYSPYHNLEKGAEYPATLVTTADTDDRVVPAHSFKFAARLQYAHAGDEPVLIRIETRAGHGAGKPTTKRIDEATDWLAFLVETLDMDIASRFKHN